MPHHTLIQWIRSNPRLVVLTGAGMSVASGIPAYRDQRGKWQGSDPMLHQDFVNRTSMRRRYWRRSMHGWPSVRDARPNEGHRALAMLERQGFIELLVTQNVDRLHQAAGSDRVLDLHGRLDRVVCRECGAHRCRMAMQDDLRSANPTRDSERGELRPDGDMEIQQTHADGFHVPPCPRCGGTLMPDVVFYGGSVPTERVSQVKKALGDAHALLVVGSSLAVWSGFRFCKEIKALDKPLFILNQGETRADELADGKIQGDCTEVLSAAARQLASEQTLTADLPIAS